MHRISGYCVWLWDTGSDAMCAFEINFPTKDARFAPVLGFYLSVITTSQLLELVRSHHKHVTVDTLSWVWYLVYHNCWRIYIYQVLSCLHFPDSETQSFEHHALGQFQTGTDLVQVLCPLPHPASFPLEKPYIPFTLAKLNRLEIIYSR